VANPDLDRGLAPAPAPAPAGRLDAVDWLRGLAVVLMIQTHLYDAWVDPGGKATGAYWWSRFLGGIPSRLFLLLVGVSMAIKFERQMARGVDRPAMVRSAARRGLEIVALAYLFRLQEYILGGWGDNWADLFRIDILNCIGASMVVVAFIAAPRSGRPQGWVALAAAALFVGLGPIVGPAHFPAFLPRPLTSYVGGQRPMSWFPLFPWAAWPLVGVAVGHYWVRQSGDARRRVISFALSGVAGLAMTGAVMLVRRIDPYVIRYPSEMAQQMGPGTFFYRLGLMGPLALLAFVMSGLAGRLGVFSVMRQFGLTSLLVYWVHVDLCYGLVSARLHHRLSMTSATIGFVLMTSAMLVLSVLKTKYWRRGRRRQRRPAPAMPASPGAF
jgi:uncharacterized membrane protein